MRYTNYIPNKCTYIYTIYVKYHLIDCNIVHLYNRKAILSPYTTQETPLRSKLGYILFAKTFCLISKRSN